MQIKINHIALWGYDIELLKEFYCHWFGAEAGKRYHNPRKNFTSYFMTFPGGGTSLEIMNVPEIINYEVKGKFKGLCHISISLGSKESVDEMTELMRKEGVSVIGEPRTTGDGFYESVVTDPEGNLIELTV